MRIKIKEWFSIQLVKNPSRIVLGVILLFNIVFFLLASVIISAMSLDGTEKMGIIEAAFCTITMILDAGCIQFVVADIGKSGVAITIVCLCVVLIGMISFTGSVIGYITNYISSFIENSNAGKRKLNLTNHFVILNWNSRASEIINDMLYSDEKQKIVVLVQSNKEEIEKEIEERLTNTISRENRAVLKKYESYPFIKKQFAIIRHRFKKKVTVIVRQGDTFSSKQLNDISLSKARSVIILGSDMENEAPVYGVNGKIKKLEKGNPQTIKTLMLVSDITSDISSADNQRIIVEITDEWTLELVRKIIDAKQVDGKCNIVPVKVNEVLGQLLSQFCLMPELNGVYSELFSNKGAEFHSVKKTYLSETDFIRNYLKSHNHAVPITTMRTDEADFAFYLADNDEDINKETTVTPSEYSISLNKNFWIERKNVIILGHNSKCKNIMAGFSSFSDEWKKGDEEIVRVIVVDDKKNLEKMNYYRDYPFVIETVEADVYDKEVVSSTIERFVSSTIEDVSILILSDDSVEKESIDSHALANLIYAREIIDKKVKENPEFDVESIDIIVEIIDPKHYDLVNSYSVNNVVISNRYISKMITQISEYGALFEFYSDILSYDSGGCHTYGSKEIYIKKVKRYFDSIPEETTADNLIRAVFDASVNKEYGATNTTVVLGYVKPGGAVKIFGGDLTKIPVKFEEKDKIILFSAS